MKNKKSTWGGKRIGSGAKKKKISDKKTDVTVYLKNSTVKSHGGKPALRKKIISHYEKES